LLTGVLITAAFSALSTTVFTSSQAQKTRSVFNESPSNVLGFNMFGAAVLSGPASGSPPGTRVLGAGGVGYEWAGPVPPGNALTVIGQAAFQHFTAWGA
jgi:hypothetical protein